MPTHTLITALVGLVLSAPPTVTVHLGDRGATGANLQVSSTTVGDDGLTVLREGEWSMGQVKVRSTGSNSEHTVTLRIAGGARLAPVPALVRRGLVPSSGGQTEERETFIQDVRIQGADVVATVPRPVSTGAEDHYDLVDLSQSSERVGDATLIADPRDDSPVGRRRILVLVHGQERPVAPFRSSEDPQFKVWDPLRTAMNEGPLRNDYKIYLYRYPLYRSARFNGEKLAQMLRKVAGRAPGHRIALLGHDAGVAVVQAAAGTPYLRTRLIPGTPQVAAAPAVDAGYGLNDPPIAPSAAAVHVDWARVATTLRDLSHKALAD